MGMAGGPSTNPGSVPPSADEWEKRGGVFEHSYDEVLSALKHQDDKLGRALAAQAFLTAAGITIFTQLGKTEPLTFDGQPILVTKFFFLTFLVSIALALAFTLSAIGPSTPYRGKGSPRDRGSLLFYASIRKDPDWNHRIEHSSDRLRKDLAQDFHNEAQNLAERVHYKVTRAREAAAFVFLALASLALLGTFSLAEIDPSTRWWIGTGIFLLFSVLPLWDLFHMQTLGFPEGQPDLLSYVLLAVSIVLGAVLLALAPSQKAHWCAVIYMLVLLLFSKLGLLSRNFARALLTTTSVAGVAILVGVICIP